MTQEINEVDAMEFYNEVVDETDPHKVEHTQSLILEADNGAELEVHITNIDRKFAIDKLNRLPEDLLEQMAEAEVDADSVDDVQDLDPDEAPTDTMATLDGDAIGAFEELVAEGLSHPELSTHHFEQIVRRLDLGVLFEIGALVLESSLEDDARVTGFRTVDSDKSS